jgi:CRP/FNR family transcriptional regulator
MKKMSPACDLKSCFLCRGCVDDWLPAIEAHKQTRVFKKGTTIFSEGAPALSIYFLYKGKVKVHKQWGDKKLIVHFAKEGEMIGYRGLGNEKIYPVTATALEDVTICSIDVSFFEATLKVNHELTYNLMQFYANELQDAERRMRDLAHMEVKGRVAETLLMLQNKFGRDKAGFINITLTKQDLSSYAGTTYETFFRMIKELTKEKVIKLSGKNISILKEAKLEALRAYRN